MTLLDKRYIIVSDPVDLIVNASAILTGEKQPKKMSRQNDLEGTNMKKVELNKWKIFTF